MRLFFFFFFYIALCYHIRALIRICVCKLAGVIPRDFFVLLHQGERSRVDDRCVDRERKREKKGEEKRRDMSCDRQCAYFRSRKIADGDAGQALDPYPER